MHAIAPQLMTRGFQTQLILATVKLVLPERFDLEADYHSSLWRRLIFIAWSQAMLNSSISFLFLSVAKEHGIHGRIFAFLKGKVHNKEGFKTGNKCFPG